MSDNTKVESGVWLTASTTLISQFFFMCLVPFASIGEFSVAFSSGLFFASLASFPEVIPPAFVKNSILLLRLLRLTAPQTPHAPHAL